MSEPDGTASDDTAARRQAKIERLKALDEKRKRVCERDLLTFMRAMWPAVEPARAFKQNWHIGAVCEHLQALRTRQIGNLLINQPPATTKSVTVSVMFPAWCWATDPWMRFMCLSFDQTLASRDNVRMRNVVTSEAYQSMWPIRFSEDRNEKTNYATVDGGWRIGTSFSSRIVGEHPHGKIVDDPHNTKAKHLTDVETAAAIETWDYGLSTRGVTLNAWTVLLMQRLHENDLSGHVLRNTFDDTWVHLCLPMKYEPPAFIDLGAGRHEIRPRMKTTPLGWDDPRTRPGELLWPDEWSADKVDRIVKSQLGPWGEAGQFQQRPSPEGGLLFQRIWFKHVDMAPPGVRWVRSWDVAGTEGGTGARTAGVKMGVAPDGRFFLDANIVKGRWGDQGVQSTILQTASLDGPSVQIIEEQEPGSAGKAVIAARARSLAGYDYRGLPATGDKVTRARPMRTQAEAGNIYVVTGGEQDSGRSASLRDFYDEIEMFPLGATRDQVDAAAGAFNALTAVGGEWGLLFGGDGPTPEAEDELARLRRKYGMDPEPDITGQGGTHG